LTVRGEWAEEPARPGARGVRRAGNALGQVGCACLGVVALIILSCSLIYFLVGMTSVAYHAWEIVAHWLLIK
jgi:hypothetical protein